MCYSPKIDEKHIPVLYKLGKLQRRPMTKVVNEAIENYLVKCKNCLSQIDVDDHTETAYCDFCDANVFVER